MITRSFINKRSNVMSQAPEVAPSKTNQESDEHKMVLIFCLVVSFLLILASSVVIYSTYSNNQKLENKVSNVKKRLTAAVFKACGKKVKDVSFYETETENDDKNDTTLVLSCDSIKK